MQHVGLVKWWNDAKGFGFISSMQGHDLFAHFSQIKCDGYQTLEEGQEVSYTLKVTDKGLIAENITVL